MTPLVYSTRSSAGFWLTVLCLVGFSFIPRGFCAAFASPSPSHPGFNGLCDVNISCRPIRLPNGDEIPTVYKKTNPLPRNNLATDDIYTFSCMIPACLSDPCKNEGTCTETLERFTCECSNGFTGSRCEKEIIKVFISHERAIYTSIFTKISNEKPTNLLELEYRVIKTNATDPIRAVEYDPEQDQVYFAFGNRIDRIRWDGSEQQMFLDGSSAPAIRDLTLDVDGRTIYWVRGGYSLWMSAMNIQQIQGEGDRLYNTGISNPFTVFFDRLLGNLYWSETFFVARTSRRVDGTHQEVVAEHHFKWPRGLFVDPKDDRVYWSRHIYSNNIESVRLNGTDRKLYFPNNTSSDKYWRFLIYDGMLYWSATNTPGIGRVNVTGDDLQHHPPVLELRVERDDDDDDDDESYGTVQLGSFVDFYVNSDSGKR